MDKEQTTNDSPDKKQKLIDSNMKDAYFDSLSQWTEQVRAMQLQMTSLMLLHYSLNNNCNYNNNNNNNNNNQIQPARSHQPIARRRRHQRRFNPVRVLDDAEQREVIRRYGGRKMLIAPFWKRALAEIVDSLILSIIKIVLAFGIGLICDIDLDSKDFEDDEYIALYDLSMDIIALSYELLIILIYTKLIVCCYEGFWTIYNDGATPGKWLMNIRVVYVEAVVPDHLNDPVQFIFNTQPTPQWAMMYPCETPCLMRSLLRAFTKNMVMTFFFPVCIVMLLLKNNRTTYDVVTKTVVIETNCDQPMPRRH